MSATSPASERRARGGALFALEIDGDEVTVRGEVDTDNRDALMAALRPLATRGGHLVVDLRGLTFLDSAGISCLVEARGIARQHGGSVIVLASEVVHRALTMTALDSLLRSARPLHPSGRRD